MPNPAPTGHTAAGMIIPRSRRGSRPGRRVPNGWPTGSPRIGPTPSSRSAAATASNSGRCAHRIDAPMIGLDFSPSQLAKGRDYLEGSPASTWCSRPEPSCPSRPVIRPRADLGGDLAQPAEGRRADPPRGGPRARRRLTAHNEDTDVTYNRYGYDTAAWYRAAGFRVVESGPIPTDPNPAITQFCVAVPWRA